MHEVDLIGAFHGAVGLNSDVFFGYVSLMSAFLVVCYLVAHKLPTFLAAIVVLLFTTVSALLLFRLYLNGNDAAALLSHIQEQQALGNLDAGGFASNPPWSAPVVITLEILATLGGYIGCIAFFVYRRRMPSDDA